MSKQKKVAESFVRLVTLNMPFSAHAVAGQFMAGLSGGQRKLLLFELIFQRTTSQDNLLIICWGYR